MYTKHLDEGFIAVAIEAGLLLPKQQQCGSIL